MNLESIMAVVFALMVVGGIAGMLYGMGVRIARGWTCDKCGYTVWDYLEEESYKDRRCSNCIESVSKDTHE